MASSGTIKSWVLNTGTISGNSCAGAYYSFEWTSSKKSAGVTTVSWNLYGRGRTSSPTKLENEIYLDVVKNGATTRLYTLSDSNGTEQTSFKNYLRASGSFDVTHSNGAGSFTINMKVDIYTGAYHSTSETATLDANYHNYTVSYNANGGSGAPSAQTKVHGTNLTLSSTKPKKSSTSSTSTGTIKLTYAANGGSSTPSAQTGTYTNTTTTTYTFSKWNTNSSGTGTDYSAGGTYSSNASVTLYAKWSSSSSTARTANPSITTRAAISRANGSVTGYTVTYNANGGSSTPTAQTSTKTRKYTFSSWKSSSGSTLSASTAYTFSASATLTAQWSYKDTNNSITLASAISRANGSNVTGYKVTFNANGGSSTPDAKTSTRTPKYAFSKWNTKSDGSGTNYSAGASYTPSSAVTLYATWTTSYTNNSITLPSAITKPNTSETPYTVTLNANGGSCSPASLSAARTTSYTFKGWNTNSSGSGTNYSAGASYTPSAATTLYAKWTSSTSTAAVTLPTPTRAGHTFNGWYTAASGGTKVGNAGASYTPSGNVTLYAQWTIHTHTLTLVKGTGVESFTGAGTYNYGVKAPTTATASTGYHLTKYTGTLHDGSGDSEWTLSTTGTTPTTHEDTWTMNADRTITVHATKNTYAISYNANGGTSSSIPASQTKTYGTALTLSSTKPTRSNSTTTYTVTYNVNGGSSSHSAGTATKTTTYTFSSWNTTSSGTGTSYSAGGSYTANAAATLYAQWSSSSSTTSVTLPTPTRTGYTFRGWSTSSTATSGTTGSYTPTGNVTLYATWAKNQITVNLKKDGSAWSSSGKVVSLLQSGSVVETLTASSGSSVVFSSGTYSGSYQVRVTGYSSNYTSGSFTATYTSSQTINFYTLTCSAGTGITSASGSGVYHSGESASIIASVKTGYTWGKWSDGNTTRSRTITVSGKTTLTASATANTYTIQYLSTYGTGSTASSSHTYDTSKALTSNGFSRTGYTFLGWSTSSSATSATYTNGQSVKNLSSTNGATITLYAVWQLSATWSPTLVLAGTSTAATTHPFGTLFDLIFNTIPNGTFSSYQVTWKIGTTSVSTTTHSGTTGKLENVTIAESSLSKVSTMRSSYSCSVTIAAIDASGATALTSTINFTLTITASSKPTLSVTTELIDLTGICPNKELGRYTKLLIKPSFEFKYGATLNEYEIYDPTGKSVYLTQVQNPGNYTTAPLDLSAFSGYYSTSDPKLSWVVKVWDSRGQEASTTVTQSVKYNIPSNVHAYVPYIWSGSAWVKYTPEIASSSSISSSDIYVPFIKD